MVVVLVFRVAQTAGEDSVIWDKLVPLYLC